MIKQRKPLDKLEVRRYSFVEHLNDCLNDKTRRTIKMKKTYKIEVDCAHCAMKMEDAAKKTAGVADATVSFMTQKMKVEILSFFLIQK